MTRPDPENLYRHPNRRAFLGGCAVTLAGSSLAGCKAGAVDRAAQQEAKPTPRTLYIAAYDTESPGCLAACRKIVEVHKRWSFPATFFITGVTLDANKEEFRDLLGDPLFEVASHTWSHRMLRDHPWCGGAVPPEEVRKEIILGRELVEKVYGKPCIGLRPGCGFDDGMRGAPEVLAMIQAAGYKYVSSLLWGPDYSMPALLDQPFPYTEQGFGTLWELPGHGWHENLLKNHNGWGPRRVALWPAAIPDAIPKDFVKTPEDEFNVHRVFVDHAATRSLDFVSLIWHPWSLDRFDPQMKMLDLLFAHVQASGLQRGTYADLYRQVSARTA